MTDGPSISAIVVAIAAALPATVIALATLIKANKIHDDTNSNLTKVTQELSASNARIMVLQSRIEGLLAEQKPATAKED